MNPLLIIAGCIGFVFSYGDTFCNLLMLVLNLLHLNYFIDLQYVTCNSEQKLESFKRLITFSTTHKNNEPEGIVFGNGFFGFLVTKPRDRYSAPERVLYLFASKSFLEKNNLIVGEDEINKARKEAEEAAAEDRRKEADKVNIFDREGNYMWLGYISNQCDVCYDPLPNQQLILDAVSEHNQRHRTTTVLLYGSPGSGKSMIPLLLAKQMKASLVDTFNPTDPGDTMGRLLRDTRPSRSKKLIVVFEEVDIMIERIHHEKVEIHKDIPVLIKNKQEWNSYLDKFDRKFYQNIILIMTTNKTPEYFDSLDPSYMRDGRVNLRFEVNQRQEPAA